MVGYEMATDIGEIEFDLVGSTCSQRGLSKIETFAFLYIYSVTKNGELGPEAFDDAEGLTLDEQIEHIDNHFLWCGKEERDMFKRLYSDVVFRKQMVQRYMSDIKPYVDNTLDLEFFVERELNGNLN